MNWPHFTRTQWFKLPLKLKQRWWKETDYGKNDPSDELMREIMSALGITCEKSTMVEHGDAENET